MNHPTASMLSHNHVQATDILSYWESNRSDQLIELLLTRMSCIFSRRSCWPRSTSKMPVVRSFMVSAPVFERLSFYGFSLYLVVSNCEITIVNRNKNTGGLSLWRCENIAATCGGHINLVHKFIHLRGLCQVERHREIVGNVYRHQRHPYYFRPLRWRVQRTVFRQCKI